MVGGGVIDDPSPPRLTSARLPAVTSRPRTRAKSARSTLRDVRLGPRRSADGGPRRHDGGQVRQRRQPHEQAVGERATRLLAGLVVPPLITLKAGVRATSASRNALVEAASTVTKPTRASPIISADAVAAVRSGMRTGVVPAECAGQP